MAVIASEAKSGFSFVQCGNVDCDVNWVWVIEARSMIAYAFPKLRFAPSELCLCSFVTIGFSQMAEMPTFEEWKLPAYRIPLDANQASVLGYFTAIWGQIDYFVGISIAAMLKTDIFAAEILMQNVTAGPRLGLFYKLVRESNLDADTKRVAKEFYKDMSPLIEKRNHILHGIWGVVLRDGEKMSAGVRHPKSLDNPILVTELIDLTDSACKQTHRIVTICTKLTRMTWTYDPENSPMIFFQI